jgi:hypothetical protein
MQRLLRIARLPAAARRCSTPELEYEWNDSHVKQDQADCGTKAG